VKISAKRIVTVPINRINNYLPRFNSDYGFGMTFQVIKRSLGILDNRDRKKAFLSVGIHASLGILDILAVIVFGLVGSLAVSGISSGQPGNRVESLLNFLKLSDNTLQFQVACLGLLASFCLLFKSVVSLYLSKRTLFFFSRRSALISQLLITRLLGQEILKVKGKTVQETIFAVTAGVQSVTVGILGSAAILVSDLFLIVAFSASLFVIDTLVALCSLTLFASIGIFLYLFMHKRAQTLGEVATRLNIESNNKIAEVVSCYRELLVKDRRGYYARDIGEMRLGIAEAGASLGMMTLLSKYVMEITMVAGGLFIGAVQFVQQPAARAVAVISIFLIASARIAPAILRAQTGLINIRNQIGSARPTLDLIEEYLDDNLYHQGGEYIASDFMESSHEYFLPSVSVRGVSFRYPDREKFAIKELNIDINPGEFVGIVGHSGSGKTTLVDLILGILTPTNGSVEISGRQPNEAFHLWPGAVAYVPQEVSIVSGSIKENICLGYNPDSVRDLEIEELIRVVRLEEILDLPEGIHTLAGEAGGKLSGGQRQRVGLARALFTNPKLLILDEATSALDATTEREVTSYLSAQIGRLTMIVVAHRLSTVIQADRLVYIKEGNVLGMGPFKNLRIQLPELDEQALSMGL